MQADKLRACPFCGDAAKLIESVDTGEKYGGPSWKVACESPMTPCIGGFINLWQCTPEDAVAAWNKRAAIAEAAEDLRAVCAQLREELAGWESDFDTQASHCIELMQERATMTELLRECRPMVWAATEGSGLHIDAALRRRIDAALSTVAPVREGT